MIRTDVVSKWLARSDWTNWTRSAITGDASSRGYERLIGPKGRTAILMNAPPEICGSQKRFVEMAAYLRGINLAAPKILEWDEEAGLMVLEDLGEIDFAQYLQSNPKDELHLYEHAVDVVLALQSRRPPEGLTVMTPTLGAEMIDLAFEWAAPDTSTALRDDIKGKLKDLLTTVDDQAGVLSLRDFHAENLIWRPDQTGLVRVGLLDFQDAFVAHPVYDIASLLRDARRDVSPDIVSQILKKIAPSQGDLTHTTAAFHIVSVQRNLRILGIFQRLAQRDGKANYLDLIPRVADHIRADLNTVHCTSIAPVLRRAFPDLAART